MPGIEGNKDPAVKAVEKNLQAAKEKPEAIKNLQIDVDGKSEDLQRVWNPEIEADGKMDTKEKADRKEALDKAVDRVIKEDPDIKKWNSNTANKNNQITKETIYAWIFADQLGAAINNLEDEVKSLEDFKKDTKQVKALQDTLSMLGFLKSGFKAETYDANTTEAVLKFQESQTLTPAKGDIDTQTIVALKKLVNNANPKPEKAPATPTVAENDPHKLRSASVELPLEDDERTKIAEILNKTEPNPNPPFTADDLKNLKVYIDKAGAIQTQFSKKDTKNIADRFERAAQSKTGELYQYLEKNTKGWSKAFEEAKTKSPDKNREIEKAGTPLTVDQIKTTLGTIKPETKGMKGQTDMGDVGQVHDLQNILYSISKLYPDIKCSPEIPTHEAGTDGIYGTKTATAVSALQTKIKDTLTKEAVGEKWDDFVKATGIDQDKFVDGNFGPKTKQALQKFLELNPKAAETPKPVPGEPKAKEPTPATAEAPIETEKPAEKVNIDRIQKNLARLKEGLNNEYLIGKEPFIYANPPEGHPEILLWLAASPLGDNATVIRTERDKHAGGTKISLIIEYTDGRSAYVPPSIIEKDRETYIPTGTSAQEKLVAIKRALIQGIDRDQFIKIDDAQRTVVKADALKDSPLEKNLQLADRIPETINIPASKVTDGGIIIQLQEMAQDALGTNIKAVEGPATQKLVTYLQTLTQGTQEMDKKINAMLETETDLATSADSGLPLTIEDKQAILVAFLKDNQPLLEAIYKYQVQLKATLSKLKTDDLPKGTKPPDATSRSIELPATYEVTVESGSERSTEHLKTIDFNNCTETVVTDVAVSKVDGKTVITTTELNAKSLAEGKPAAKTETKYTLVKEETEAEDSLGIDHMPKVPKDGKLKSAKAVGNNWEGEVATTKEDSFDKRPDEADEQIRFRPKNADGTVSDDYITLDLDVKSNVEFEKGQWIDSSIKGLQRNLGQDVIKQIIQQSPDTDLKVTRPIYKYEHEDDSSKVGYVIFDNTNGNIITISANKDVNVFSKPHEDANGNTTHGFDKTKIFLGEDQKTLDSLTKELSPALKTQLQEANYSAIKTIPVNEKSTPEKLGQQFATLAQDALGLKLPKPERTYDEKSELGKFAKDVLEASKEHNNIVFSKAYKQLLVAAFMKDNQEALGEVASLKASIKSTLSALSQSDAAGNLKLNMDNLTIQPSPECHIKNISGIEPIDIIELSDNSKGVVSGITYSYNTDGGVILSIQRGTETLVYVVEKNTDKAPETLEEYNDIKAQKIVGDFFTAHGITTKMGQAITNNSGPKTYPLTLSFNGLSLKFRMDINKDPSGSDKTMISIYEEGQQGTQSQHLSTLDDLLKFACIRNILQKTAPTRKDAASTNNENQLPPQLEALVKDAVSALESTPIKLRATAGNPAVLEPLALTNELRNKAFNALGLRTLEGATNYKEDSHLAQFAKDNLIKIDGEEVVLPTQELREKLIRAFLKDNGGKLLGIGRDATT